MHSSHLRGSDFSLEVGRNKVDHASYFAGFDRNRRLGLVTPDGIEGVGAMVLIMGYITAFYDTYRAAGGSFYAYPDFYTFQNRTPLASYTMLDIWPTHKDVYVEPDPAAMLNAITDRGINILLVPDHVPRDVTFHPAVLESARRTVDKCFLYSRHGQVKNGDLTVESDHSAFEEWGLAVLETAELAQDPEVQAFKAEWQRRYVTSEGILRQSFRSISLDDALTLI